MASTGFTSNVGQDQFLQLLVAQMKSQNPLEPTTNQEFLGQLAQFSTLSGIEKLNANFSDLLTLQQITDGANLIGKHVSYMNSSNQSVAGVVSNLTMSDGAIQLHVGADTVGLDKILGVAA